MFFSIIESYVGAPLCAVAKTKPFKCFAGKSASSLTGECGVNPYLGSKSCLYLDLNQNLVNEAIHIPQVVSCILHVDQLEKKIWLVTWLWVIVVRTYPRLVSPQETNAGTVRTS